MEKGKTKAFLVRGFLVAALLTAAWAVRSRTDVANTDEAGIVLDAARQPVLPAVAGAWRGQPLLHCSAANCGRGWLASELRDASVCPRCGAPLDVMNTAERRMLPADTGFSRFTYARSSPPFLPVSVAVVLSGNDRTSIHRPQVCMTAAGWEISGERVCSVDLGPGKPPLELTVLDMTHAAERPGEPPRHIYYAYWFVGKGRLCATHLQRMWWMAYDRIVHGVSHRWAYVALSGERDPASDAHLQTIANFASQLHPLLLREDFSELDSSKGNPDHE